MASAASGQSRPSCHMAVAISLCDLPTSSTVRLRLTRTLTQTSSSVHRLHIVTSTAKARMVRKS